MDAREPIEGYGKTRKDSGSKTETAANRSIKEWTDVHRRTAGTYRDTLVSIQGKVTTGELKLSQEWIRRRERMS